MLEKIQRILIKPQSYEICKSGMLLGHIVSVEGVTVNLTKVAVIRMVLVPKTTKELNRFVGQVQWHGRMLCYLADVMLPCKCSNSS